MKQKILLKTMLLLCALIVGNVSAWADIVTFDATTDIDANAQAYQTSELTINATDGSTWKANGYGATAYTNIVIGKGGANYLETPLVNGTITSVEVTWSGNTSYYLALQTTNGTELEAKSNPSSVTKETFTVSGTYSQLRLVGRRSSGTNNAAATITKVVVNYTTGSSSSATPTTVTINDNNLTNTDVYTSTVAGSLSATVTDESSNAISGATVSWESSDEDVATIDDDGVVTLVAAGTTTITASYAGVEDQYQSSSATYELTVTSSAPYVQPTEFDINLNDSFFGTNYGGTASGITDDNPVSGTQDNVTVTYAGGGNHYINASQIRFYPSNKLTFEAPSGYEITEIVFTSDGTWTATISADGGSYDSSEKTWTGNATSVVFTGSVSGRCDMSKATIKIALLGSAVATTTTIDASGITNTDVYAGTAAGSLSAAVTVTEGGAAVSGATVTWSGSNNAVATIDPATGAVTLVAAGSVTFTASYAGVVDEYSESSDTYEMTVTNSDPNAPGTENNPYTVTQAIAATPASGSTGNVYIRGIVSRFWNENSSIVGDGTNYRYFIRDGYSTPEDELLVYKGTGLNQAAFTNADDLMVGDEVVIYGKLTKYDAFYEVASGNYLVDWNRPSDTTPSIILSSNSIEATVEGKTGTINVTYKNITDVAAEVYFCDINGDAATYNWITADINSENNVEYIIVENTGDSRTAYMKVWAYDDDLNEVYSELITITQEKYVVTSTYTLATSITSGKHYVIASGTSGSVKVMGAQNTNNSGGQTNRAAVNGTVEGTTLTVGEASEVVIFGPEIMTIDNENNVEDVAVYTLYDVENSAYLYALSSSNNYLAFRESNSDANGLWTIEIANDGYANIKAQGDKTRNWIRYNSSSTLFSCYGSGQANVYLYEKSGEATPTESKTLNAYGYATYCSQNALDFTNNSDVSSWAITGVSGETITFSQITGKAPAGTGMLLKGAANASVSMSSATGATALSSNLLEGTLVPLDVTTGEYYGLSGNTFVPVSAGTVPAGKALLPASEVPNASRLTFVFEDVQGIATIEHSPLTIDDAVYNLNGQRVTKPTKGLYIINGRKTVVK